MLETITGGAKALDVIKKLGSLTMLLLMLLDFQVAFGSLGNLFHIVYRHNFC